MPKFCFLSVYAEGSSVAPAHVQACVSGLILITITITAKSHLQPLMSLVQHICPDKQCSSKQPQRVLQFSSEEIVLEQLDDSIDIRV